MGKNKKLILAINLIIIIFILSLTYIPLNASAKSKQKYDIYSEVIVGIWTYNYEAELNFTEEEKYMLAKIAMAEAEAEDIKTKALIIMSVLNRVKDKEFPDNVKEVILENNGKIYQYSPVIPGGRWYKVEPDKECYEALELALSEEYDSEGALYFEDCKNADNWHSKNLTYLYENDGIRFYK